MAKNEKNKYTLQQAGRNHSKYQF